MLKMGLSGEIMLRIKNPFRVWLGMVCGYRKRGHLKLGVLIGLGVQLNISPHMGQAGSAFKNHPCAGLQGPYGRMKW